MSVSFVGMLGRVSAAALVGMTLAAPSASAAPLDPNSTVIELSYTNLSPLSYGKDWFRRYDYEVRRGHAELIVHGKDNKLLGKESRPVPEALWSKLFAKAPGLPTGENENVRPGTCLDFGLWDVAVTERGQQIRAVMRDCPDDEQLEPFFTPVEGLFDMKKYAPF